MRAQRRPDAARAPGEAAAREEGYLWGRKVEELGGPPRSSLVLKERAVVAALALFTVGIWILGVVFLLQLVL
jgi:hypothetical protein